MGNIDRAWDHGCLCSDSMSLTLPVKESIRKVSRDGSLVLLLSSTRMGWVRIKNLKFRFYWVGLISGYLFDWYWSVWYYSTLEQSN